LAGLALGVAACGGGEKKAATTTNNGGNSGKVVEISVGYENAKAEPAAKAVEKWKELVEKKSNGTIKFKLFPNSALGKKTDLIDQMVMGQKVITVADGAFLAEYGVPDFGIFYAPFMFDSWDEEWNVIKSDWYKDLCNQLASKGGIRVLSSNWIYGARHIMSTKKVVVPSDLRSLKMRVSSNDLSIVSFKDLGANALGMDMGEVYQALQAGTIDAVENPLTSLANRSFQEVAKYVVLDNHILATSMWICGEKFYKTLTPEQQKVLAETADEAGLYNNQLYDQATKDATDKLKKAGVTITELTPAQKAEWVKAGQKFYQQDTARLKWSDGLYNKVKEAGKKAK
jgi:tripartite ATP-independent transporter DctP family solute receptor